jgi:acyl-CoA synthetase (AMP-forming)/AMP-acid ligase II
VTTFAGPPVGEVDGIGALTLGGLLDEVTARGGDDEAVVFDDPLRDGATVRLTYADLRTETRRIARALVAEGVERGDAVGIVMGSRPEAVAATFAVAMVGAVAVPLSTFAPPPELAGMLARAGVTIVLTQTRLLSRRFGDDLRALRADRPALRRIVVLGEDGDDGWERFLDGGRDVTDDVLDGRAAATSPDDPALVIFSSGTTSAPKGVLHAHRAPAQQMWVQAGIFGRHRRTRMWTSLPLFWTAGFNTAVGATLAAGGCWVAQETFSPGEALALMSRERVTEPYSLPHQTAALEEHPDWAATDLSSLTCVFGKGAYARHPSVVGDPGWTFPVGYGMSETCGQVASHRSDAGREAARRSTGPLLPGVEVRVVDPGSGRALGVDEEGELTVRGPMLMLGYLGSPAGADVDDDGFFRTGDAGHVDAAGELHFGGRRSEVIKTGGANVSPAEIEVALRACPPVKLSRVVGVPDPRLDQLVTACIVLKDGAEATESDIQAFLRDRISAYKVPKRVLFFAEHEMPMTSSDTKVRDEALLALVDQRLADPNPR